IPFLVDSHDLNLTRSFGREEIVVLAESCPVDVRGETQRKKANRGRQPSKHGAPPGMVIKQITVLLCFQLQVLDWRPASRLGSGHGRSSRALENVFPTSG